MVRGITAYGRVQKALPKAFNLNQAKNKAKNVTTKMAENTKALPKLLVLPGAVAGMYSIVKINPVKCGGGCDSDFDCDWNVYTFG